MKLVLLILQEIQEDSPWSKITSFLFIFEINKTVDSSKVILIYTLSLSKTSLQNINTFTWRICNKIEGMYICVFSFFNKVFFNGIPIRHETRSGGINLVWNEEELTNCRFYTEQGNWDLVGNNTPIFFIRDPFLFPNFIHTQKRNPVSHINSIRLRPKLNKSWKIL